MQQGITGKRRPLTAFYRLDNVPSGEEIRWELNALYPYNFNSQLISDNSPVVSPYQPFIPVAYTLLSERTLDRRGPRHAQALIQFLKDKNIIKEGPPELINKLLSNPRMLDIMYQGVVESSSSVVEFNLRRSVASFINNWVRMDRPTTLQHMNNHNGGTMHAKADMINVILGQHMWNHFMNYQMKTHRGLIGPLLWIQRTSPEYIPYIMGVVLPEDYIYQKIYLLMHNTIDLSRVTILVNKELDNPQYEWTALRNMYKSEIEPSLRKFPGPIWKVPASFIMEHCFTKPFRLESKNPIKRKQEIDELIEGFINKNSERPVLKTPYPVDVVTAVASTGYTVVG